MAKYIGAKCRLARREKTDLFLKSSRRAIKTKCNFEQAPGVHGKDHKRLTDYGVQMRMKQLIKRYYGLLEKQFHNCYVKASRVKGSTGEHLLRLLECRLDNVVYRMGFAVTRAEARQMVNHRSVTINGRTVNIPSCQVKPGDVVAIKEKAKKQIRIGEALKLSAESNALPDWMALDASNLSGTFKRYPEMNEYPNEFKVYQVVELYSK